MQEGSPRGDEAGEWLRGHFKDDPEPTVSIAWDGRPISQSSYQAVLDILFGPANAGPADVGREAS